MTTSTRSLLLGTAAATASLWLATLTFGSTTAFAATTATLKASQQGATASAYDGGSDCSGYTGTDTLWHFVVPALDASPGSSAPDITGFSGSFDGTVTGFTVVQNGKGVDVLTSGATIVHTAEASLNGDIPDSDAVLVLSNTCVGTGGSTGGSTSGGTTGTTGSGSTGSGSTGSGSTGSGSTGSGSTGSGSTGSGSTGSGSTGSGSTGSGSTGSGSSGGTSTGGLGDPGDLPLKPPPDVVPPVTGDPPLASGPDTAPVSLPVAAPVAVGDPAPGEASGSTDGAATAPAPRAPAASLRGSAQGAVGADAALPMTGAPVALVWAYGLATLLAGCLLLALGKRPTPAAASVARATEAEPPRVMSQPGVVPSGSPWTYPGRHARPGGAGVALLLLVSAAVLVRRASRR